MWTPNNPAAGNLGVAIEPDEVFYSYDGPAIFRGRVGLSDFLFFKVDEGETNNFFLLVPASSQAMDALAQGALSLRGALATPEDYWIVEISDDLLASRYWRANLRDLPDDFLPESGYGLGTDDTQSADTIEQACSFFSVRFAGELLGTTQMPFSRFKGLVDDVYASVRKIFPAPLIDQKSIGRVFDFEILEPKFGSLIIAVNEPVVEKKLLKKSVRENFTDELVQVSLHENRTHFFENMTEIVEEARRGEIDRSFAIEHFMTLDQISEIVPTDANKLDHVEFRGGAVSVAKPVFVDNQIGPVIRQAHRLAESSERQLLGVVVEINAESGTFIIKDFHHRLTTCLSDRQTIDAKKIQINSRVKVSGAWQRRARRDLLHVRTVTVLPKSAASV